MHNAQKKDYAKLLCISNRALSYAEIAQRADVSTDTIHLWAKEGNWEVLRNSMVLNKSEQIGRLYAILNAVTNKIAEEEGIGDTKLADMMIKYTTAIRALETDNNVAEVVECMMQFGAFVQRHYPQHFALVTEMSDAFVMDKIN